MNALRRRAGTGIRYAIAAAAASTFAAPVLWLAAISVMQRRDLFRSPPSLRFAPTVANLRAVFIDGSGFGDLLFSGVVTVVSAAVAVVLGLLFVLPRMVRTGKVPGVVQWALPMYALPSTVIAIPFFFYAQWLGIPWWMSYGAALCAIGVVLAVLLLSGYLRDLKRSAIEGLCVHEPAEFKRHVRVVGWDARAVIGVTALFCFLGGWHDLVFGAVLSSGALRPLNVSILGLITPIGTFWGEIAARSVPSIMVAVICVALAGEGILRGFALGRSGG